MKSKPFILVYTGPTGVGKTSLVDAVADAIPSEIVNIDMGQFYVPLSIGTAKPILSDFAKATSDKRSKQNERGVVCHLFDVIAEPRDFTVAEYRKHIITLIQDIWNRGKVPILVGGSGFYVRSLFFPPLLEAESSNKYAHVPKDELWDHLYEIDPERAGALERQDYYRIERALDIWYSTGRKPSECLPVFDPPCAFRLTCVTRNRDELYDLINQRTNIMLDEGWLDEVDALRATAWEKFLRRKKLIGYMELFDFDKAKDDKQALIARIQQKTRNYAKRQMTFWRSLKRAVDEALKDGQPDGPIDSKTDEINLTLASTRVYIKRLLVELEPILKELQSHV